MMFEAIEVIKKLFTGKDVKHEGELFKPAHDPAVDACREPTAADPGRDGRADHRQEAPARAATASSRRARPPRRSAGVLAKFAEGARRRARTPTTMPKLLQLHLSWAPTDEEAMANAMTSGPTAA